MDFNAEKVLKWDALGSIEKGVFNNATGERVTAIRRVYTKNIWIRPLAKFFAWNEKRALKKLAPLAEQGYVPVLLSSDKDSHIRSFIEGDSIHRRTEQLSHDFFLECKKFLTIMRQCGVANNDLAKEANWLITPSNLPAVTDFQLALSFTNIKSKLFLILCREDVRHLLKHKRKYDHVTLQEMKILNNKSLITRIWMQTGKKAYLFLTRKILGWQDRLGPEERNI